MFLRQSTFILMLAAAAASSLACDGAGPSPAPAPAPLARCRAPAGVPTRPATIAEVLSLVNALPQPLTLPCLLETLDRPLDLSASRSLFSFQPAEGARSPRIFLYTGTEARPLVWTLVPEGDGGKLIEFGQFIDETRSLKGEIAFPVDRPLETGAPFTRIRDKGRDGTRMGTTCRGCHAGETNAPEFHADAFVSEALRPDDRSLLPLQDLRKEHTICDEAAEPDRCAMLSALFDHGEVREKPFPAHVPTIFD